MFVLKETGRVEKKGGEKWAHKTTVPKRLLCTNKWARLQNVGWFIFSVVPSIIFYVSKVQSIFQFLSWNTEYRNAVNQPVFLFVVWKTVEGLCHYLPLFFLHSMTGGKSELKISSHNDLRPLTCIWQSSFYLLFLRTKPIKKCILHWTREWKENIFKPDIIFTVSPDSIFWQ